MFVGAGSDRGTFVGRVEHVAALDAALAQARAGTGRIALLVGDPGIGKTRLTEEFAARARAAGAQVLAGRCYEGAGAPAFWPWVQVVRAYAASRDARTLAAELGTGAADVARVVHEVADRLPGIGVPPQVAEAQARFRFFDALTRALGRAAERAAVVIVLEDLHGADASSLLLLQFLAREVRQMGVLVVATSRPVALVAGHPLSETMGELVREQVSVRLDLEGLSADQVGELMARMANEAPPRALVEQVHARTEGNPLYVTEVVRMLLARGGGFAGAGDGVAMPDTVRTAIGRHLGALSETARETLRVAALFGREFRAEVIARADGRAIERVLADLDEATVARVVAPQPGEPGRYRFAHALFAETLVDSLGAATRVSLHCRAATALATGPYAADAVAEIAHHWIAAGPGGDPAAAVDWAHRAGERAADVLAYEEAVRWFGHALTALRWLGRDEPQIHAATLIGLGEAAKRVGEIEQAKAAFEQAAALARGLGSAELLTRAALGYAPPIAWAEHPAPDPRLVTLLEEAIASWGGRESGLHARAIVRLGMVFLFAHPGRRSMLLASGVAMARRIGDDGALRYALAAMLGGYERRFESEPRLAIATELLRLAEPARDLEAMATGRLWRCVHILECGDGAGAKAELASLETVTAQLRQPAWDWEVGVLRIMFDLLEGRLDGLEQSMRAVAEVGRQVFPYAAPTYLVGQVLLLGLLRGDADPTDYRAVFDAHPDPVSLSPAVWAEALRGRHEEARKLFERIVADDFKAVRDDLLPLMSCVFLAETCALLGDAERAATLRDMLGDHARLWLLWGEGAPLGPVAHSLGILERTMGRWAEGAAHFEDAIADCRRIGARPFLARTLFEYAMLLRARDADGDAARAASLLDEARFVAVEIGLSGLLRRIEAVHPEAGGRGALPASRNVFRREGDVWVVSYAGVTVRLRDARGLRYLATLLHHPAREFHATALVSDNGAVGSDGGIPVAADGVRVGVALDHGRDGVALDARAQRAYRERMADLAETIAEAERLNDSGRTARAREELAALREELASAGRGDRSRTHGERARLTITKGIGTALARIDEAHPALGAHLRATVRRGYFCSYVPDPRHPIEWER